MSGPYQGAGPIVGWEARVAMQCSLGPRPPFTLDIRVWHFAEILGLLTQHYQKSGEPIRLLILADQVVRIALPKRTLESCN